MGVCVGVSMWVGVGVSMWVCVGVSMWVCVGVSMWPRICKYLSSWYTYVREGERK